MQIKQLRMLFDNPLSLYPDLADVERNDLSWFINLTSQYFRKEGYFLSEDSYKGLNFPDVNAFDLDTHGEDKDIARLYQNFAWRGFLTYCEPIISDNKITGFAYKGNVPLSDAVVGTMVRFPSVDWVNTTLVKSNIAIADNVLQIIEDNKIDWTRENYCFEKKKLGRMFALLYLMDKFPFVRQVYNDDLSVSVACVTRSPEFLQAVLPSEKAKELIYKLENDGAFTTPCDDMLPCVELTPVQTSGTAIDYKAELVNINIMSPRNKFLPYYQYSAYADGFNARINDNPTKAAVVTVDLRTTAISQRYCTTNEQVYKDVYAGLDLIKTNARTKFKCGIGLEDFRFKYWNLQSSINTHRTWSGFTLFAVRNMRMCDTTKLNRELLDTEYDLIQSLFTSAIDDADKSKLKMLASACGIDPKRPALDVILRDFMGTTHPSDLYKIMQANKALFNLDNLKKLSDTSENNGR